MLSVSFSIFAASAASAAGAAVTAVTAAEAAAVEATATAEAADAAEAARIDLVVALSAFRLAYLYCKSYHQRHGDCTLPPIYMFIIAFHC